MKKEFKQTLIALVLGLGNPGPEYGSTYHNGGLLFARRLIASRRAEETGIDRPLYTVFRAGTLWVGLSKVFMNQSGSAASDLLSWTKEPADRLLVAHDDSDLEIGTYKFSFGSGSAGHNGAASVVRSLGHQNFWRLRIGIRDSGAPARKPAGDFVLAPISPAHREKLDARFATIIVDHFPQTEPADLT